MIRCSFSLAGPTFFEKQALQTTPDNSRQDWGYLYHVQKIKYSLTEGHYTNQYTWLDMIGCNFSVAGPTFVEKQALQTTPDNSRQLQTTPDNSRQLQTTPDNSRQPQTTPDIGEIGEIGEINWRNWR
jgi:hypothetical protein